MRAGTLARIDVRSMPTANALIAVGRCFLGGSNHMDPMAFGMWFLMCLMLVILLKARA
jgi:hypothetical protein